MLKYAGHHWILYIKKYTLFFYKNLFYKNVEAEVNQNFKNVLRTFLRLRVDKELFYFANLYRKSR